MRKGAIIKQIPDYEKDSLADFFFNASNLFFPQVLENYKRGGREKKM
jgi:hypothetical protein